MSRIAGEIEAGLVVMTMEGHIKSLDAIYGSYTEYVLRASWCLLLVIPVDAWLTNIIIISMTHAVQRLPILTRFPDDSNIAQFGC